MAGGLILIRLIPGQANVSRLEVALISRNRMNQIPSASTMICNIVRSRCRYRFVRDKLRSTADNYRAMVTNCNYLARKLQR